MPLVLLLCPFYFLSFCSSVQFFFLFLTLILSHICLLCSKPFANCHFFFFLFPFYLVVCTPFHVSLHFYFLLIFFLFHCTGCTQLVFYLIFVTLLAVCIHTHTYIHIVYQSKFLKCSENTVQWPQNFKWMGNVTTLTQW